MDTAKLNDWVQIVGIFALVASLIFVGLQLKQSQDIALSQAYQSRADNTIEMLLTSAENPVFVSAVVKNGGVLADPYARTDTLTPEEQVTLAQYARAMLFTNENLFYQYTNGFLPAARWRASREALAEMIAGRFGLPVRALYEENPDLWSAEYQAIVNEMIRQAEAKQGDPSDRNDQD